MGLEVGDPVFNHFGRPAVVVEAQGERIRADTDEAAVTASVRHGYIKGLAPPERGIFNAIMDQAMAHVDPRERVDVLSKSIADLEAESKEESHKVVGYLRSQLAHFYHSYDLTPRVYGLSESDINDLTPSGARR